MDSKDLGNVGYLFLWLVYHPPHLYPRHLCYCVLKSLVKLVLLWLCCLGYSSHTTVDHHRLKSKYTGMITVQYDHGYTTLNVKYCRVPPL